MIKSLQKVIVVLLCFFSGLAIAQERTVTGKVTSEETGEPLPGVNVVLTATSTGTITDTEGNYRISVPAERAVLNFSFIGFESQEIEVGARSVIDVSLQPDVHQLSEVVITGFQSQQKQELSGAVAQVDGSKIENMPVQSFDRAIQGRMAGVQVQASSGIPGAAVSVRVRGSGSINAGNEPLYIIDGVQINASNRATSVQSTNPLAQLNPNDIETITVLKDASAAAIYGAQAGNGVVIITTKRGTSGEPQVNFNVSFGAMEIIRKRDVLNAEQFTELTLEAYENAGIGPGSASYDNLSAYLNDRQQGSDWQEAVFKTGFQQNYDISLRGGNDKSSIYLSSSYSTTDAHVVATTFDRFTLKANVDYQVSDKLNVATSINLSDAVFVQPPGGGAFANPYRSAHLVVPINSIYDEEGEYNLDDLFGSYDFNVLWLAENNEDRAQLRTALASLSVSYELFEGLTYRARGAADFQTQKDETFWDPRHGDGIFSSTDPAENGYIFNAIQNTNNLQTDHTLSYNKNFNGHAVSFIGGVQYRQETYDFLTNEGNGLANYQLRALSSTSIFTNSNPSGNEEAWKLFGVFGKLNYIFNDKYIVSASVRRDGSSRFGEETKYGTFPAGSVAWRLGDEAFLEDVKMIEDLKLRVSYGVTGNQSGIGNFSSRGTYSTADGYNGVSGFAPSRVPNALLSWEEHHQFDLGIDFGLFNNRLNGAVDYFVRDTKSLLLDRILPSTTGFGSVTQNIGEIRNSGIEVELQSVNVSSGDFQWRTSFNITFLDSEVLSLTGESDTLVLGNAGATYIVGQESKGFYAQQWAGVNPADGRPMWYDEHGNITYNYTSGDARVLMGSANPDYYGGISNTFTYGGLSLDVFFQYQVGNLIYNAERTFTERSGSTGDRNQDINQLNRWTEPGQVTDVPQAVLQYSYENGASSPTSFSSRFVEKGDYLRLKQLTLGYQLPQSIVNRIGLRSLNIYAQGINLLTVTEYTGFDPELADGDSEFGDLPQAKTYLLGLNIGL